jgi:hypothetical protein
VSRYVALGSSMAAGPGTPAPPLSAPDIAVARHDGDTLKQLTEDAATATGCELVRASDASVDITPGRTSRG